MADFSNLKEQIIAAIRANGVGAITGPLLQEQLLAMIDAMEIETYGGLIDSETVAPSDITRSHVFIAVQPGVYDEFALTVEEGDIWLVARPADITGWSMTNLAAGLKSMIAELQEGKQNNLLPGDGININDDIVSVKLKDGGGLVVDGTGEMSLSDDIPTAQDVVDYIDGEKGAESGIAGLDENGKVPADELPDDLVGFAEEGFDPTEINDEYKRLLAVLYQSIDDVQATLNRAEGINAESQRVADSTRSAGQYALNAKDTALEAAAAASRAAANTQSVISEAEEATEAAQAAAIESSSAAAAANSSAQTAETAAANADSKSVIAENAATNADNKATLAENAASNCDEKAAYAQEQGDYSKEQGDYAKQEGDYAADLVSKGIVLEETLEPTDQELQDEYERLLRVTYQGIEDMQQATEATKEATVEAATQATRAEAAASSAEGVISDAQTAATAASNAANSATEASRNAQQKAEIASQAAQSANQAAATTQQAVTDAQTATAASVTQTAAAQSATEAANDAAYAAIHAMDDAKGIYPTLAARLDAIDERTIVFVEDASGTFDF